MARRRDFLVDKKIGSVRSVPYTDWGFLLSAPSKRNPKRDGLGTISTLGAQDRLSSVSGDGGAVSRTGKQSYSSESTAPCR